jgi:hypothetical protein
VGRHSRRLNRLRINAREIVTELRPRPADAMFAPAWPLPRQRPLVVDVRDMGDIPVDFARP